MKIAVASQNKKTLTGHAGKCTRFYLFTLDSKNSILSKELLELPPEKMLHNHFHGPNPEEHHPLFEMNFVITENMGMGFQNRMAAKGIKAVATAEKDIDTAVELLLKNELPLEEPHRHHHH
jgi:predicted Fe-Mo cluster-binding NifX family protein